MNEVSDKLKEVDRVIKHTKECYKTLMGNNNEKILKNINYKDLSNIAYMMTLINDKSYSLNDIKNKILNRLNIERKPYENVIIKYENPYDMYSKMNVYIREELLYTIDLWDKVIIDKREDYINNYIIKIKKERIALNKKEDKLESLRIFLANPEQLSTNIKDKLLLKFVKSTIIEDTKNTINELELEIETSKLKIIKLKESFAFYSKNIELINNIYSYYRNYFINELGFKMVSEFIEDKYAI